MSSVAVARARAKTWAVPATVVRAVPAVAWLAGLVALSAVVRYGVGRRMVAPWIIVDEVIYAELARSFAAAGDFLVRGEPVGFGYGVVYPVLISPAYLIDSLPEAYATAKAINAVLISLAAVPAYLLARRVLTPAHSLAAALLAVAVPSMFYAGTIMTENAFYPLFLTATLALVGVLERPTPARTALFLAAFAVAFLTRAQAVVFLPAALTAPLLMAAWRRSPRALLEFRWLYGGLAAAAGLAASVAAARGLGPGDLLGAYKAAADRDYDAGAVARWFLYHVAELDLYLGIAPFAAFLLLLLRPGRLGPRGHAFLAAAATLSGWLLLQVAAFATQPSVLRVEERNMFYVAPLFFVALLLWIERGVGRPPLRVVIAAGTAAALPAFLPYPSLIGISAVSDTLAMLSLWRLAELAAIPLEDLWAVIAAGAAVVALLFALLPRRALLLLPGLVLVLYAVGAQPIDARTRDASVGALFQGIRLPERDWIDQAVGPNAEVAVLWTGVTDRFTVNQNEFFSRSVGRVFHLDAPTPGALPETIVAIDPENGQLRAPDGSPIVAPYLLTDESVPIDGRPAARDQKWSMVVYRLDRPVGVSNITEGLYRDLWSGPAFTYTGFHCAGETLRVRLQSDFNLFEKPQTVVASAGGREVARVQVRPEVEETVLTVPLEGSERCTVRFSVTPTAVPAQVRVGSEDTRRLGVRVLGFARR